MIHFILMLSLSIMVLSIAICAWRLVKGPSLPDRVAALDTIGINLLAMVAVLSILFKTQAFIEYILLIGILSFIGTMALARYIERGWCLNMEMIKSAVELLFVLLILTGALLSAVSSVGLIRLPDVYLRSHAAAKSATLGVLCILSGAFLYFAFFLDFISAKLLLGIVFVFMTSPLSAHLTGRAAYRTGVPLWNRRIQDDLKAALEKEEIKSDSSSS